MYTSCDMQLRQMWLQPVLHVLLHSFSFIQLALSLLQLFKQRLHLRFHALHLRLCLKCLQKYLERRFFADKYYLLFYLTQKC